MKPNKAATTCQQFKSSDVMKYRKKVAVPFIPPRFAKRWEKRVWGGEGRGPVGGVLWCTIEM